MTGDVAHVARPFGPLRLAESRMRRHVNGVVFRQLHVVRQPSRIAYVMMQHQHRRTAAALEQLHLASGHIDETLGETHLCCAPRLASGSTIAVLCGPIPFVSARRTVFSGCMIEPQILGTAAKLESPRQCVKVAFPGQKLDGCYVFVARASRSIAGFSARSESEYSCHALLFAIKSGAVRIVKRLGSRSART